MTLHHAWDDTMRDPSAPKMLLARVAMGACGLALCLWVVTDAQAQGTATAALRSITISAKANRDPVEKSYRKMLRGMDLFDKERATAPNASLRFKLLPRKRETDMNNIDLEVIGTTVDFPVSVAPDHTFTLLRNPQAFEENAQVVPDRKAQSMTWRTEIRSPGLPPGTRRLGDLRLECRVGMEAGLVSSSGTLASWLVGAVLDTPAYCDNPAPLYLFFAEKPLFSVTLVDGQRSEVLAIDQLYAAAIDNPKLGTELPDCDCEVLVDRTYFLPLGDHSWSDDTKVLFEYMDDTP
jgi:hypothetical protein